MSLDRTTEGRLMSMAFNEEYEDGVKDYLGGTHDDGTPHFTDRGLAELIRHLSVTILYAKEERRKREVIKATPVKTEGNPELQSCPVFATTDLERR